MRVEAFDFPLPEDRIALRPAEPRDSARLLVVGPDRALDGLTPGPTNLSNSGLTRVPSDPRPVAILGPRVEPGSPEDDNDEHLRPGRPSGAEASLEDRQVADLPALLRPGDVLVFNNTKVIPAQLHGTRERDGAGLAVSITLAERIDPSAWWALARPGRRLKAGDRIRFGHEGRVCLLGTLGALVAEKHPDGRVRLVFDRHGAYLDEALQDLGDPPLPPYIAARRPADERDRADYQTIFAAEEGAVAAPTAGLHFTPDLFRRLDAAGIAREFLTLHVGPGTFLPVKAEDIADHRMHAERGVLDAEAAARLNAARQAGGRIVAVGTTSLRLLESAADPTGTIQPFDGATDIFITPGYHFRAVDLLLTNFHLPRSTLFMLVAAFSGLDRMKAAYAHAVAEGYRFYSYGDACLLYPAEGR